MSTKPAFLEELRTRHQTKTRVLEAAVQNLVHTSREDKYFRDNYESFLAASNGYIKALADYEKALANEKPSEVAASEGEEIDNLPAK